MSIIDQSFREFIENVCIKYKFNDAEIMQFQNITDDFLTCKLNYFKFNKIKISLLNPLHYNYY